MISSKCSITVIIVLFCLVELFPTDLGHRILGLCSKYVRGSMYVHGNICKQSDWVLDSKQAIKKAGKQTAYVD
ncbi:hypothetical protein B0T24DRAFT_279562 [Lasiosphaeria ovina]|uniref:Uncharacterized protein n=1 Tax=Lasiosphaeria ovina TaxID=92902 RepID=A0AAE0KCY2_9PEZI|nr:hypothetical protein B0T24DRAFT_279562 [Lasiosphaeria ovina]